MDNQQKRQIVAAIKAEMAAKNLSQNGWADKKRISKSHMSNILKESNWHKVGEKMWQTLATKVQVTIGKSNIYPTSTLRSIHKACKDAQDNKLVNAISAYTGAGKTTALQAYDTSNENTHYLVCRSSFGVKDLVIRIAQSMGINAKSGRTVDIEDAILERMINTPNTLLILDSVSKLRKEAAFQFIGDLCESTEHKAGIVIAGTEFLKDHMEKMVRRNKRGFREFDRRIYQWVRLKSFGENKTEIREICKANGIWSDELIEKIIKESTDYGKLYNNIAKMHKAILGSNRN